MFNKFNISNFRTHLNTEVRLKDMTLVIGSNNSGKSNLLAGLSFFSRLVSIAFPENNKNKTIKSSHYFENKHHLSGNDKPIVFYCEWERESIKIKYELAIYCVDHTQEKVACSEQLKINHLGKCVIFEHGRQETSDQLLLRTNLNRQKESPELQDIISNFFRSLSSIYYYNFQPALLKGQAYTAVYFNGENRPVLKRDFSKDERKPNIASALGKEGGNFQELIQYVKENESETYNRFLGFLKRFEDSFVGIHIEKNQVKWQFDMGNSKFPFFDPDKISDGLIKAGAVALLCAMKRPPSLIMIEEVENGINQKNLSEFLKWLVSASENGNKTQFILTSHSPSVVREFADRIESVYNVHLKKRRGYVSEITNLNDAIKPLISFGSIDEDDVSEEDGIVYIRPHALTELFYNGVLAEL